MLAFEVSVNGTIVCVAGIEGDGVLTSMLTWVHRQPDADLKSGGKELEFDLSGLVATEHLHWFKQELRTGDSISVRIIDVASVDAPAQRKKRDPQRAEKSERAYYERLKQKYEGR